MIQSLNMGAIGHKTTLADTIQFAKQYGFQGVDFSIGEAQTLANQQGVAAVQTLFAESGIAPAVWGLSVEYRKDDATWRQGLEALPAQAKLARQLGALCCNTWLMPCDDERNFANNWRFHVNRLRPVAQILGDYGIRLGLEFIGPKTLRMGRTFSFAFSMDAMLGLAATIDTGNVGLLLDIWHLYTSHGLIDDVRRLDKRDVVSVHINDAPLGIHVDEQLDLVRALPGATGVLDIAGFLQALRSIGYAGPVTAEPFDKTLGTLSASEAAAKTAAAMKAVYAQAGL